MYVQFYIYMYAYMKIFSYIIEFKLTGYSSLVILKYLKKDFFLIF